MITFFTTLFVTGSLMFWILTASFLLIPAIFLDNDEGGGIATMMLAIYVALIHWCGDASWFSWIGANPLTFIKYFAGYAGIGLLWSFAKFYFKLKFMVMKKNEGEHVYIPEFRDCKSNIVRWMTYWPISMIGTLLSDFVRNTFKYIATKFNFAYKAIYDHVTGGVNVSK